VSAALTLFTALITREKEAHVIMGDSFLDSHVSIYMYMHPTTYVIRHYKVGAI